MAREMPPAGPERETKYDATWTLSPDPAPRLVLQMHYPYGGWQHTAGGGIAPYMACTCGKFETLDTEAMYTHLWHEHRVPDVLARWLTDRARWNVDW